MTETPAAHERKKAHHRKTRLGCTTCKIRRVKCDETKPLCNRCTSTGRTCDGYAPAEPRRRRKKVASTAATTDNAPSDALVVASVNIPNIAVSMPNTVSNREIWAPGELRGFQFFQERLASSLRVNGGAGPFWNELIPQTSETYPAVKHMAVAVASLQESLEKVSLNDEDDSGPPASMSLEQCNLGIQELISSVQKTTPKEIMLTTCILLVWFELLRSKPRASEKYLELGLGMMQKSKVDVLQLLSDAKGLGFVGPPPGTGAMLNAVFAKMTATAEYTGWGMHTWESKSRLDLSHFDKQLPSPFGHLIELWTYADIMAMFCNRVVRNLSNRTHVTPDAKFANTLEQKLVCFIDDYTRLNGTNSPFAAPQISTISSLFNMLHIIIRCSITCNDELAYDDYTNQFSEIVHVLRKGLDKVAEINSSEGRLTVLPFGIWAVPRLYFVATFCRTPRIRREAIDLLFKHRRREASIDSWVAAKIAEIKMHIEEEGLNNVKHSRDIPASHRIRIHCATYDASTRHVVFRYMYAPYDESTCEIEEKRIEWLDKVNDLATDDTEMVIELLQIHQLFLKASTSQAPSGVVEPMYYHDKVVTTVTEMEESP